jgi:hypothetical protein
LRSPKITIKIDIPLILINRACTTELPGLLLGETNAAQSIPSLRLNICRAILQLLCAGSDFSPLFLGLGRNLRLPGVRVSRAWRLVALPE